MSISPCFGHLLESTSSRPHINTGSRRPCWVFFQRILHGPRLFPHRPGRYFREFMDFSNSKNQIWIFRRHTCFLYTFCLAILRHFSFCPLPPSEGNPERIRPNVITRLGPGVRGSFRPPPCTAQVVCSSIFCWGGGGGALRGVLKDFLGLFGIFLNGRGVSDKMYARVIIP